MVENSAGIPTASIVDRLSGKRILLTGVTGFLGQVIFERLLGDVPGGEIVLLVRSQTGSSSRDRVEYLFRKPAFDVLRAGSVKRACAPSWTSGSRWSTGTSPAACRSCPETSTS